MKYCQDCGTGHDCDAVADDRTSDAVRIAELETRRDVEIARINARAEHAAVEAAQEIAEIEADATVEAAAVEGAVIGAAIESGAVAEESAEPVIINADPPPADDGQDVEELPPAEGSPAPAPAGSRRIGLGAW